MMRRPLGRGLDALIENTRIEIASSADIASDGATATNGILTVPVERIVASPLQPRRYFDPERLAELADAIRSQGVIEPLVVREMASDGEVARYELVAGERRLRAAREAGLAQVPVIVRELGDDAALEVSLVENLVREDLNAVEEGRAFVRLNKQFGLTHEQIAGRIGKSRPYITNAIRLLELPLAVVEMVARGEISAGQARPLLVLGSAEAQIGAARRIAEGKISARGAEEIASAHRPARRASVAVRGEGDPNLNALAESIQRSLKRKVRIARRRGKTPGTIVIEYYNEADLTALVRTLVLGAHVVSSVK